MKSALFKKFLPFSYNSVTDFAPTYVTQQVYTFRLEVAILGNMTNH